MPGASDHSTHYDALMKLWRAVKPSKDGPATDFRVASLNIKMGVVTKNATGRSLKDLSDGGGIPAALRMDVKRFDHELSVVGSDHELSVVGSRNVEDAEGPETNKLL